MNSSTNTRTTCTGGRPRRAMVLASVILIIASLNILVMGIVIGGGEESRVATLRIATLKAFFAAESGIHIMAAETAAGRTVPSGTVTLAGGETLIMTVTGSDVPYSCTVTAHYGVAVRRVQMNIN